MNPITRTLVRASAVVATACTLALAGSATAFADTPPSGPLSLNIATDCPDMQQGVQSECVRALQQELRYLGSGIDADSIYGPATAQAVLDFQTRYNLRGQDSIAGPETRSKLQIDYADRLDMNSSDPNKGVDAVCGDLPILSHTCSYVFDSDTAG